MSDPMVNYMTGAAQYMAALNQHTGEGAPESIGIIKANMDGAVAHMSEQQQQGVVRNMTVGSFATFLTMGMADVEAPPT